MTEINRELGRRDSMRESYEDLMKRTVEYINERDYWRRHFFALKRSHKKLQEELDLHTQDPDDIPF